MDHKECVELLTPYIDGELTPDSVAAVEEHVRTCPHCTEELRRINALHAVVRRGMPTDESVDMDAITVGVMNRVRDESSSRKIVRFVKSPLMRYSAVAAVAAMLMLTVFTEENPQPTPRSLSTAVRVTQVLKTLPVRHDKATLIAELDTLSTRYSYHQGAGIPTRFSDTRIDAKTRPVGQ